MGPGFIQEVEAEVTEYDPPNRACYETRSGMSYRSCREFEAVDGGTRVTETLAADPGLLARFMISPMVRLFARTQRKNLQELKRQLEAGADSDEGVPAESTA